MKLEQAARQVVANGVQGTYAKYYSVPPADFEALREALAEQAEQEPVAYLSPNGKALRPNEVTAGEISSGQFLAVYLHPVRTKDLTDDEITAMACETYGDTSVPEVTQIRIEFARAVIAADRKKNK